MAVTQFRIGKGRKPGKIATTESTRYGLDTVRVAKGRDDLAWLGVTDGKIALVQCLDAEAPAHPVALPPAACNANGTDALVRVTDSEVFTTCSRKTSVHERDSDPGRFPALHAVFHAKDLGGRIITLDAGLLKKLADAMSDDGKVTLILPPVDSRPIIVLGEVDGAGLLMPCSADTGAQKAISDRRHRRRAARALTTMPRDWNAPKPEPVAG